ncbi:MAG: hypothetical protein ACQEQA_02810 [Bacillota bacterium]
MDTINISIALGNFYLVAETKDQLTRITFDISRNASTLVIHDYTVERSKHYFDKSLMHAILLALKNHGVHHVLTDVLPDGLMPECGHLDKTLHCDLHTL